MAIFYLAVQSFSRSIGRSATAAAAYRSGERICDDRTGEVHDFRRKAGVIDRTLIAPHESPNWTRSVLWNAVEASEKRRNSMVARECLVALPHELCRVEQVELAKQYGRWLSDRHRIAVDVCVHEPTDENDLSNVHAHLLLTTRQLGAGGFGAKTRELSVKTKSSGHIEAWRKEWGDQVNAALEHAGFSDRVDHRSNLRSGLDELPMVHEGRGRASIVKRAWNVESRAINSKLRELLAERAREVAKEAMAEAEQQADAKNAALESERARDELRALEDELEQAKRELLSAVEGVREAEIYAPPRETFKEADLSVAMDRCKAGDDIYGEETHEGFGREARQAELADAQQFLTIGTNRLAMDKWAAAMKLVAEARAFQKWRLARLHAALPAARQADKDSRARVVHYPSKREATLAAAKTLVEVCRSVHESLMRRVAAAAQQVFPTHATAAPPAADEAIESQSPSGGATEWQTDSDALEQDGQDGQDGHEECRDPDDPDDPPSDRPLV